MRHANRISSKKPHRTEHWCYACDRAIVSPDKKCPKCGHVNNYGKTRFKSAPEFNENDLDPYYWPYRRKFVYMYVRVNSTQGSPRKVHMDLTKAKQKIKNKLSGALV